MACLIVFEQELPRFILRFDFFFLPRCQVKSLGRVAQSLAGYCTFDLFEGAVRPQDSTFVVVEL